MKRKLARGVREVQPVLYLMSLIEKICKIIMNLRQHRQLCLEIKESMHMDKIVREYLDCLVLIIDKQVISSMQLTTLPQIVSTRLQEVVLEA